MKWSQAAVDASIAFDRLDHYIPLDKLVHWELPTSYINTILHGYQQSNLNSSFRLNFVSSAEFKVLSGVDQGGSSLPILFNAYVNDLFDVLKCCGDDCHIINLFIDCMN